MLYYTFMEYKRGRPNHPFVISADMMRQLSELRSDPVEQMERFNKYLGGYRFVGGQYLKIEKGIDPKLYQEAKRELDQINASKLKLVKKSKNKKIPGHDQSEASFRPPDPTSLPEARLAKLQTVQKWVFKRFSGANHTQLNEILLLAQYAVQFGPIAGDE